MNIQKVIALESFNPKVLSPIQENNNFIIKLQITSPIKMKVKTRSTSNSRKSVSVSSKKSTNLSTKQIENDNYFCHFKNAIYMGGIKSFQKNGKGIILHDNGSSVLASYYHDLKHGHNVIYRDNCLLSIDYNKNKISECMIRIPNYLFLLKYNRDQQPDGKAILLEYSTRTINYVTYRRGAIVDKKQQKEYSTLNRVFDLQNLEFLIGVVHSKILNHQIERSEHIMANQVGNKLNIGFYKRGLLNGIGFTLLTKSLESSYEAETLRVSDQFYLRHIDRGYYINSQLSGMGEKWFKNGNFYIGDFKGDIFEGRGILKNALKNNWVFGNFAAGNMMDLIDYNHEGDTKKYNKLVEAMHERKNSWINKEVQIEHPQMFIKQIDKILAFQQNSQMKTLEQRKQEVLRRIQENFICDAQNSSPLASSRHLQSYHQISKDENIQKPNEFEMRPFANNFVSNNNSNYQQGSMNQHQHHLRSVQIIQKPINSHFLKLYEVPNTKDSSQRDRIHSATMNRRNELSRSNKKIYNSNYQSPGKISNLSHSGIKRESTSYNLDSKRMIGRSRLFKYLNNQPSEEQPPHFNYVPAK